MLSVAYIYVYIYNTHIIDFCVDSDLVNSIRYAIYKGFPGGTSGKEPARQCRRLNDAGSNPGSGRSLGGGHGNPLQYPCLESPTDRGAWQSTVNRIAKSWT